MTAPFLCDCLHTHTRVHAHTQSQSRAVRDRNRSKRLMCSMYTHQVPSGGGRHTRTVTQPLRRPLATCDAVCVSVYIHTDTSCVGCVAFAHRHAVTHAQSRSHNTHNVCDCVCDCVIIISLHTATPHYLNAHSHPHLVLAV